MARRLPGSWLQLLLICSPLVASDSRSDPADPADPADPVDPARCRLSGPGLRPDQLVLPARYFLIHTADTHGNE